MPHDWAALGRMMEAEEALRSAVAAELHDRSIQEVVAISLRAQIALDETDAPRMGELERIRVAADAASSDLRDLIAWLRAPDLERGLVVATRSFASGLSAADGRPAITIGGPEIPLSVASLAMFRLLQDFLRHGARAAPVDSIEVVMDMTESSLTAILRTHPAVDVPRLVATRIGALGGEISVKSPSELLMRLPLP